MSSYVADLFEELWNVDLEIEHIEGYHIPWIIDAERDCHEARALILADIRQYYGL